MVDPRLAEAWLQRVEDPQKYGIPELNFLFWQVADEEVKQAYLDEYKTDLDLKKFIEERYDAPPFDFESLGKLPESSFGYAYYHQIVDNGLSPALAAGYRAAQDGLDAAGMLKGMPDEIKYTLIRGFQMHDAWHVLAGYDVSSSSEVALQAFTLAQMGNSYPAFWMSVLTSHGVFKAPQMLKPYMDAIAEGWTRGRKAKSLMPVHWEEMFDRPLAELRREYNLV